MSYVVSSVSWGKYLTLSGRGTWLNSDEATVMTGYATQWFRIAGYCDGGLDLWTAQYINKMLFWSMYIFFIASSFLNYSVYREAQNIRHHTRQQTTGNTVTFMFVFFVYPISMAYWIKYMYLKFKFLYYKCPTILQYIFTCQTF